MARYEPSSLEIALTQVAGVLGFFFYRSYVYRLPLQGNEAVLDFGAGSGACARYLAARLKRKGGRVTCVDISNRWYEVIQKNLSHYRNVNYRVGDIEHIPLPNRTYDAIFIHFVLHDIPVNERPRIIQGLALKLKPGGQWFIREPVAHDEIAPAEINHLLTSAGFVETSGVIASRWPVGKVYEGIFR